MLMRKLKNYEKSSNSGGGQIPPLRPDVVGPSVGMTASGRRRWADTGFGGLFGGICGFLGREWGFFTSNLHFFLVKYVTLAVLSSLINNKGFCKMSEILATEVE